MRLNYYRFPENTPDVVKVREGCEVFKKGGGSTYCSEETFLAHINEIERVDDTLGGLSVTHVKDLMKEYGGCGWTEHIERDGGVFEVTEIQLKGNNSRFKYNHHL